MSKRRTYLIDVYQVSTVTYRLQADSGRQAVKFWEDGEAVAQQFHDIQVMTPVEAGDSTNGVGP